MKKESYLRLQDLAREINDIMLANDLHETTITATYKTWYDNTNSIQIHTKKYDEYSGLQDFHWGSINISSDDEAKNGSEYDWQYEDFMDNDRKLKKVEK